MLPPLASSIQIILIDDCPILLWGLEQLIERADKGIKVIGTCPSSAEAFRLMDKVTPDVILLDIDLGGENAIDAIPKLIAQSKASILVFTGLRDTSLQDKAVLAGARGVVEKRAPVEIVLTAIQKIYEGQLWLDHAAAGRIFVEFSRKNAAVVDPEWIAVSTLTNREREVIAVAALNAGAPAKTIAGKLHVSEHTFRNHLTSIYGKLGVRNRLALFAFAQKHGLTNN